MSSSSSSRPCHARSSPVSCATTRANKVANVHATPPPLCQVRIMEALPTSDGHVRPPGSS
jgi:hypothetical protein